MFSFAAAVANSLPNLTAALRTQITNDIRNGAESSGGSGGGGGDAIPQGIHVWIERFTKLKPLAFRSAVTPAETEDWITHMEKLFQVLGCPDNFKTRLAAFKLEGDALSWWKAHLRTQVGGDAFADTCTWVAFREIFYNRYFPTSEQQRYEREYGSICQLDREDFGTYWRGFVSFGASSAVIARSRCLSCISFELTQPSRGTIHQVELYTILTKPTAPSPIPGCFSLTKAYFVSRDKRPLQFRIVFMVLPFS
ncbi:zinc finger, CCHC-type, retrotransposon gag domain protein [Tanacetum coccineum]